MREKVPSKYVMFRLVNLDVLKNNLCQRITVEAFRDSPSEYRNDEPVSKLDYVNHNQNILNINIVYIRSIQGYKIDSVCAANKWVSEIKSGVN